MNSSAPKRIRKAESEMIRSWHRWVRELIPDGDNSRAVARRDRISGKTERAKVANGSHARFLRRITSGKVGQPRPATIFGVTKAAHGLGKKWCALPLCLFAAGQFGWFAKVMLGIPDKIISAERKIALTAIAAEAASSPKSVEEESAELRELGASEDVINEFVHDSEQQLADDAHLSEARTAWELQPKPKAAFKTLFESLRKSKWDPRTEQGAPIIVCWLAQKHPEIGLAKQREIVSAAVIGNLLNRQRA